MTLSSRRSRSKKFYHDYMPVEFNGKVVTSLPIGGVAKFVSRWRLNDQNDEFPWWLSGKVVTYRLWQSGKVVMFPGM